MVERQGLLSLRRQCVLLGLSRAALYYRPVEVGPYQLELMALVDRQYLRRPFYGARRLAAWLRTQGHAVTRKRVKRLMQLMGLAAIYQRPRTSRPAPEHRIYPYLLRGLVIERMNQVWGRSHLLYPDGARLSLSGRGDGLGKPLRSCLAAVESARHELLRRSPGGSLEQGVLRDLQYRPRQPVHRQGFHLGTERPRGRRQHRRSRALQRQHFVERLWRSLKYEEVCLRAYESVAEARQDIASYFEFYNNERLHQSLGYRAPRQLFERTSVPLFRRAGKWLVPTRERTA
jgi:putative transposase